MKIGPLRLSRIEQTPYDEVIQEQDVPEHKTTMIGSGTRIVRYNRSYT